MRTPLFLLCALALSITPAFAQNSATTSSVGDNNSADVEQSYSAAAGYGINEVTIDQVGNQHVARAQQNGAGNLTSIDQDGFSHSGVELELAGNGNTVDFIQTGGDAGLGTGGGNRARTQIRGDENDIDVFQDGNGNDFLGHLSELQNDFNTIDADQLGDDNEAEVRIQKGSSNNEVTVYQDGMNNLLGNYGGTPDGITIEGSYNQVDAFQDGTGNTASVDILGGVAGDFNVVDLDQLGSGHMADIDQTGNGNSSTVNQND